MQKYISQYSNINDEFAKIISKSLESLKVDGVLLTLADMRTNLARATAENLKQNYGRIVKVYKTVIPVSVRAAETSAAGKSIYRYDKNGAAAKAYADFTGEVMRDGEKQRHRHEAALGR